MKRERSELYYELLIILGEFNKTGLVKELTKSSLLDEYINKTVLTKTLNLNIPFNSLSISELYHICRLINNFKPVIKIDDFFTDEEMTQAIENKNNIKIESDSKMVIENVLYTKNNNEESWVAIVTYKQIYEWMKTGKLIYNMQTQRQGVLKKIRNNMIIIPYINEKSVDNIAEAMFKNEFYSNMISFNVTPDFNYKLEYNPTERILVIDTNIFNNIAVTDGYHRCSGVVKAIEKNHSLQGELYLKITNMSIEKAQKFIRQESKTNIQNQDALEKYNPDNKITMFIKDINEMGGINSNALYRKIDMEVNTPDTWIMYENFKEGLVMSGFIDDINNTNSAVELNNMERFIVKFFDNFYKVANENNAQIEKNEENPEKEYLTDPTFIMGLLITCHKHSKNNEIDAEAMDKFIKKFKNTNVNYTYNYPMKQKDKKSMISKFRRLLEV